MYRPIQRASRNTSTHPRLETCHLPWAINPQNSEDDLRFSQNNKYQENITHTYRPILGFSTKIPTHSRPKDYHSAWATNPQSYGDGLRFSEHNRTQMCMNHTWRRVRNPQSTFQSTISVLTTSYHRKSILKIPQTTSLSNKTARSKSTERQVLITAEDQGQMGTHQPNKLYASRPGSILSRWLILSSCADTTSPTHLESNPRHGAIRPLVERCRKADEPTSRSTFKADVRKALCFMVKVKLTSLLAILRYFRHYGSNTFSIKSSR